MTIQRPIVCLQAGGVQYPAAGHVVHPPGQHAGVAAPPEHHVRGGVGLHVALQLHAAVQGHAVQYLAPTPTAGRICNEGGEFQ